jgi:hypothetical protein
MVRSVRSAGGALRYGAHPMNAERESAEGLPGPSDDVPPSRPWTPEAAMEPVPPLAPPPARPGAGTPVMTIPKSASPVAPQRTLVTALAVVLVVAAVVVLLIVFGH